MSNIHIFKGTMCESTVKFWKISRLKLPKTTEISRNSLLPKLCKISEWALSTNNLNWLEHIWIVILPTSTKVVARLTVRWLSPFCNPIPSLDLTVSTMDLKAKIFFFPGCRRVQVSRSMFTSLTMVPWDQPASVYAPSIYLCVCLLGPSIYSNVITQTTNGKTCQIKLIIHQDQYSGA